MSANTFVKKKKKKAHLLDWSGFGGGNNGVGSKDIGSIAPTGKPGRGI